jgi:uncharacterized protein
METRGIRKRLVWGIPVALVVVYAAMLVWYAAREDALVYERSKEMQPMAYGVTATPMVIITNDGVRLSAWAMPDTVGALSYPWVLYLHGNAGNISTRTRFFALLMERGVHIFAVDYRGYGLSEGEPSERGLYLDGDAAYECLVRQLHVPARNVIIQGHSLGSAVAVDVAAHAKAAGLVLDGAFTSLVDRAQELYPYLPVRLIMKNRFDSMEKLPRVTMPKLFIHATDDALIPIEHGRRLYAVASDPKRFLEVAGGHNDSYLQDEERYFGGLSQFIHDVTGADSMMPKPGVTQKLP